MLWLPLAFAFTILDSENKAADSSKWQGKWVVINYWATWCDACGQEIPELNSFYQRHQNQIIMYGVNYDNLPLQQLRIAISQMQIRFPVLQSDPAKPLHLPTLNVLPTTFILDPQGNLVKQLVGPQTAKDLENIVHVDH